MDTNNRPIVFFDGECNLCNSSVQFIIRNDKAKRFLFAPLQSDRGKAALSDLTKPGTKPPDSVILFDNGKYYIRSSAALRIAKLLGGVWSVFYAGMIIPRFIRDVIYEFVSRNRYKWFGKRNSCMIPTPALLDRFLTK